MPIYLHPEEPGEPPVSGPRPLILFIDQHHDTAVMFATYCSASGMRSIAATDGESALQLLLEVAPVAAVVTALWIPRLGGARLIERVRAILGDTLPVLVVTGEARAAEHEKALAAGANRIIVKPCDPELLLQEIRSLLPAQAALPTPVQA